MIHIMSMVVLCPKCGNRELNYSPGIDIGLMHAICMNCGYKDNENQFPKLTKKQAAKIKVLKGEKLEKLRVSHANRRFFGKWMAIAVLLILLAVILAFLL